WPAVPSGDAAREVPPAGAHSPEPLELVASSPGDPWPTAGRGGVQATWPVLSPGSLPGFAGPLSVVADRRAIRRTLDAPGPRQLAGRGRRALALASHSAAFRTLAEPAPSRPRSRSSRKARLGTASLPRSVGGDG